MSAPILAIQQSLKHFYAFLRAMAQRFMQKDCITRASALAYTSLFSLVPLIVVSYTVFSRFPEFLSLSNKLRELLLANLVPQMAQQVVTYIDQFLDQASHFNLMGFTSLLVVAVLMIFNIEQAFNAIWQAEKRRDAVSAFLLYWGVLTLTPILASLIITLGMDVLGSVWVSKHAAFLSADLFMKVLQYGITALLFAFLYNTVPNCPVYFRHSMIAGTATMIFFEIAKTSMVYYIQRLSSYELVYGALAVLPIFLFWLYVLWNIILGGAVICRTLADFYPPKKKQPMPLFE